MSEPCDPYVIGPPVGGTPSFQGRKALLAKVRQAFSRQQSALVLFGQRRIGKTSLLLELRDGLGEPFLPVYLDLQGLARRSVDEVVVELARVITQTVARRPPARGEVGRDTFLSPWLPEQLARLPDGRVLVLLFDEFDALADPRAGEASQELFPFLRPLLQGHDPRLRLVFTIGRTVDDLRLEARAFLREAPSVRVSLLERAETEALARRSEAPEAGGFCWTPEGIDALWRLTSGHPLLTQALCSALWSWQVYGAGRVEPWTAEHVEGRLAGALMTAENALVSLWDGLTPACQVVASVLALSDQALSPKELDRALQDSGVLRHDPRLSNAPDLLVDWDLLEQEPATGRWRFKVELLRRWIATRRPPRVVLPVLDRDDEHADYAFRRAVKEWGPFTGADASGKPAIEQAVRAHLQVALQNRPSHTGASKLLAEVDAATGHERQALDRLRALHRDQPMVGREPLMDLLAVLMGRDDGLAEAACKELLELEPEHPTAGLRLRQIMSEKTAKALEQAVKEAEKMIEARRYDAAIALIKQFELQYSESDQLKEVLKNAVNRARGRAHFLSAVEKLKKGEHKQAERLLALLAWEQLYEDQHAVVSRLYEATTRRDPDELVREVAALKATVDGQRARIEDLKRKRAKLKASLEFDIATLRATSEELRHRAKGLEERAHTLGSDLLSKPVRWYIPSHVLHLTWLALVGPERFRSQEAGDVTTTIRSSLNASILLLGGFLGLPAVVRLGIDMAATPSGTSKQHLALNSFLLAPVLYLSAVPAAWIGWLSLVLCLMLPFTLAYATPWGKALSLVRLYEDIVRVTRRGISAMTRTVFALVGIAWASSVVLQEWPATVEFATLRGVYLGFAMGSVLRLLHLQLRTGYIQSAGVTVWSFAASVFVMIYLAYPHSPDHGLDIVVGPFPNTTLTAYLLSLLICVGWRSVPGVLSSAEEPRRLIGLPHVLILAATWLTMMHIALVP